MKKILFIVIMMSLVGCVSKEEQLRYDREQEQLNSFVGRTIVVGKDTLDIMSHDNGWGRFILSNDIYVDEIYVINKLGNNREENSEVIIEDIRSY